MQAYVPLSAAIYLLLGLAALGLPLRLVGWAEHGSDDTVIASGKAMLALLCVAVVCLALSLLKTFSLLCRIRKAQQQIAAQNSVLEQQGIELETRNEELQAQQMELQHTANNLIGTNILLLQSSRRFQELFQGVPIACYCYDERGRIIEWNRACEALYGFPTDEIFEKYIWETICGPIEEERTREIVSRVFAGESFEGMEWVNLRADRSECRVLCNTFPLRSHDGTIIGAISANIDITERAAALELLAENEERYRRLVEHTPDAIAVHRGGLIAYVNPAGLRLFGAKKPEDILGKSLRTFEQETSNRPFCWWTLQNDDDASGEPIQEEIIRLDGKKIDIEATAIPINYKGSPALQLVIRDITERKQAEEKLKYVMAGARCLLWFGEVVDEGDGLVWHTSMPDEAAAQRFLPLKVEPGHSYADAWRTNRLDEDRERTDAYGAECTRENRGYSQEFRIRRADGEIRWLAEDVAVEPIERGRWRAVGVCTDITERKKAEEKLSYVTAGARCLLWDAIVGDNGGEKLDWDTRMTDEQASQRFLPLDLAPGQSYADALYFARVDDDRERCDQKSELAVRAGQSYSQEFRCRRSDGEIRWLAEDVSVEPLGNGRWRAVGVCLDITERKRAESISRSVTDAALCLLWEAEIVDEGDEKPRWDMTMNDEAAAQRFLPLEIAQGQSYVEAWYLSRLDDDRNRCDETSEAALKANQSYSQEFRCRRSDGEIRWLAEDVAVEPLGPGRWHAVGVCLDITERKRAEELSQSVVNAARCLLWEAEIVDHHDGEKLDWTFRMSEEAAQRFLPLNLEPGDSYNTAWYRCRLEEERERCDIFGDDNVRAGRGYSQEFRCRRADGEIRWLAEDVAVEPLGPGRWRAVGVCLDITERKRAEEMSHSIVEAGRCLLWEAEVKRIDGKMHWEYRPTEEDLAQRFFPLEITPGESYHSAWYKSRLEEDRNRTNKYGREKILADQSYSQEFRCRRADGEIRWLAEDVAVEPLGPDRWRAVGICMDVTDRKRAEEMSRSIVEAGRCLLWEAEVNLVENVLKWEFHLTDEDAAQRFLPLELKPGERYHDAWYHARLEDDQVRMKRYCREKILADQSYSQEFRCRRADGEVRWLAEDVAIEPLGPCRWRAVGVCLDITERKRAEEMSRSIIDAARCLLWEAQIIEVEGVLQWNVQIFDEEAARRFLPVKIGEDQSYGVAWDLSRHPDDRKRIDDHAAEMVRAGRGYSQEFRCIREDGEIRWLTEEVAVEEIEAGRWRAVGVCIDITERKRAEERLRYIMASAHCLFWDAVVTDQGGALAWDIRISDEDAAQRLLPLSVPKGRTYVSAWMNSRIEEDHIRMAELAGREIRAGRGYSQEFRCRRRDGEVRWLAEDVSVESLGPGRWLAVGVCLDITERKKAENVLRDDIQRFSSIIATQYDIVKARLDLNKLFSLTVERVQKLTGAASAAIGLVEAGGIAWRARRTRRAQKGSDLLDSLFAERCLESGEIVYCPDLKAAGHLDKGLAGLTVRSAIAIPLHHNQAVSGVLIGYSNETYAFGERNMQTLQLMAGLISTALEHAAEFEEKQALLAERTAALTALQESEARFKAFMDNTPAVAFMKDSDGRRVWANKTYQQRFECALSDLIGKTDFDLYPPDVAAKIQESDAGVLKANKSVEAQEFVPTPSEGMRHWWSFKFPFQDRTGQRFLGGVAFDITEQKIAEDALRESEERFRLAINSIHEGLVLMDSEGKIQLFNQSAERILGQIAEQILVDQPFEPGWRMVAEDGSDFDENDRPIEVTLRTGKPQRDVIVGVQKPDTQIVWISFNTVPLFRQGEAKPYAAVASFSDITERRRVAQQLREQMQIIQKAHATLETQQTQLMEANTKLKALATLDGLTGLKNHRAFQEKLETEFQRATGSRKPLSLLLLDVDMFKLYNDTFGHLAGDEVLKMVARILRENARANDFVARYGGEEFVVIVPRADRAKAMAVAERFRKAIESAPWPERMVTASFGVATLDETITAPSTLIAEADRALYHAKATGRNRVVHVENAGADSPQSVLFRQWVESTDTAQPGDPAGESAQAA